MIDGNNAYAFVLLALCIWREARGESEAAMLGVAWSIRNRVKKPCWWGRDWAGVVLMPYQYSSFNRGDPNAIKWPVAADLSWQDCLHAATVVYEEQPTITDPTHGADSYFDISLDSNPPSWAKDGSKALTCTLGRIHFYRTL